jgi:NADH-quinone oxidoreductase subunit F
MEKPLTQNIRPDREPLDIREYERVGGYQALRQALRMPPLQIQQMVNDANLKGRGGAGFPAGRKWSGVPMGDKARCPKFLAVNADEMEPGTFKDRLLMEGDPNLVVESAIISSYAIEADVAYIFLRWAYRLSAQRLTKAIAQAYERGYLGTNILGSSYSLEMYLHTSAGRYMCGEAEGLMDALEGTRPIPRPRPPHAADVGLWGKPTIVNNVETLANVPHIVNHGPAWFKGLSRTDEGGTKLYGMSGRVRHAGLWELPMGTSLGEIFHEHAGGMAEGHTFRGLLPGGASSGFLLEKHFDVPMDFASARQAGSTLGTGTMVVLDDRTCPVGLVHNLQVFFARESCGWCTPCREGLPWVRQILAALEEGQGRPEDLDILQEHTWLLGPGHTFCELAPGAMLSLASALKYFHDDFQEHVEQQRCPWKGRETTDDE